MTEQKRYSTSMRGCTSREHHPAQQLDKKLNTDRACVCLSTSCFVSTLRRDAQNTEFLDCVRVYGDGLVIRKSAVQKD